MAKKSGCFFQNVAQRIEMVGIESPRFRCLLKLAQHRHMMKEGRVIGSLQDIAFRLIAAMQEIGLCFGFLKFIIHDIKKETVMG